MNNSQLAKKIASRILKMNEPKAEEAHRVALMFGGCKQEYTRGGKNKQCLIEEIEQILNKYNHFTLPKKRNPTP